ncbi:MAG: LamG-like jellyroll fold domain-containing protein [Planctomycetota bacterium]
MARRNRDPYDYFFGEILRLPPDQRHPDHYTLLGLPFFERNEEKVRRAGRDRKRALRAAPKGPPELEHVRRELLERTREARRTLLDPLRREAYDDALTHGKGPRIFGEFELDEGAEFAGRFRVLRVVRRGGFGRVYAVLDSRESKRVELTVLSPAATAEPGTLRRATNALERMERFADPTFAPLLGKGQAEGLLHARWATPDGVDLAQYVRRQPRGCLGPTETARIGDALAAALARAHAAGLVHGDLSPRNVFIESDHSVRILEIGLAASLELPKSPYTAPEQELSPAADRYALGALVYFLLRGEAPFLEGGHATEPKPLPDDVPAPMAETVLGLLAREPADRPVQPRFSVPAPRRRAAVAAVAALVLLVVLTFQLARPDRAEETPRQQAWQLIEQRRYAEAIALLEQADEGGAPLASALEGEANRLEASGDAYAAQVLLARAQSIDPESGRQAHWERLRAAGEARLRNVRVHAAPIAREASVQVQPGDVELRSVWIDGQVVDFASPIVVARPPGEHRIAYRLEDRAGNARVGDVAVTIDRTAPELAIEEPADGLMQRQGGIAVRVRVTDAHPAATVRIHGQDVPWRDGAAVLRLTLPNGRHELAVTAVDAAGNRSERSVRVTVDDSAPDLLLDARRVVSNSREVVVRGRVRGPGAAVVVDGVDAPLAGDGRFESTVRVEDRRTVTVVARGPTGVERTAEVECVHDPTRPQLRVLWARRDARGRLLYGAPEMDAGELRLPLQVEDATRLVFEPSEGRVENQTWLLPAHQGERRVRLRVVDEAGNAIETRLELSGHRATPGLSVRTRVAELTRDAKAVLEIEADDELFLNNRAIEPGRVEVPLPEGVFDFHVVAKDAYGNRSEWRKRIRVDRTPPRVTIDGPRERGVGIQRVTFSADEDLLQISSFSQSKDEPGRTATFVTELEAGRTHTHVVATDLAGNVAKLKLPLLVVNRSLLLDGRSAVRVPLEPLRGAFTLEFWAQGTPAIDPAVFVSRGSERGFQLVWASTEEALPHMQLFLKNEGPMAIVAKKMRKPIEWHHYACVSDGRKFRFYLDGRHQGTIDARVGLVPGKGSLLIGARALDEGGLVRDGFIGRIDELRISRGTRYTRAFRPRRFLPEDGKTIVHYRFDLLQNGKHVDSGPDEVHAGPLGDPKLVVE